MFFAFLGIGLHQRLVPLALTVATVLLLILPPTSLVVSTFIIVAVTLLFVWALFNPIVAANVRLDRLGRRWFWR